MFQKPWMRQPPVLHGVRVRTPRPWPLPQRPTALADLLGPGVTRGMVRTQVSAGALVRIREGVYVSAEAWPGDPVEAHLLRAMAEQAVNPEAVISHGSAALVWRIPSPPIAGWPELMPTLTVSVGDRRSRRSLSARVVEAALPDHHVTRDAVGRLLTTVARTAVDLARDADLPDALVVLDGAARIICASMVARPRRRDYANPGLISVAQAQFQDACAGRRGLAAVVRTIPLVDPRRESPIESLTAAHIHLEGLPMPEFQVPIRTPMGTFYPDCYWKEHQLIGEADGAGKYDGPAAILKEKEREQLFRDLGFGVVRWLGKEITFRPHVVMERIARELGIAA